jgi:hypothetical protein
VTTTVTPVPTPTPTPALTTSLTAAHHLYVATTGSDTNAGTQSAPFRTISKAGAVAVADTIVHVAPGTYTGGFLTTKSGTASGRIRYVSDTKWGAKIAASSGAPHVWRHEGGYTDIIGFEISSDGSVRLGIALLGGNSSAQNNHVHDIATKISCSSGGGGIVSDNNMGPAFINYDVIGNLVHDIGLGAASGCNQIQGIYQTTLGNIKNNILYNAGYGAIHLWHDADHVNVSNNTIFNNPFGIIVGTGNWYFRTTTGDYNNISNNILIDNNYAISEMSSGIHGTHNYYANNLTFRNNVNYDTYAENSSHVSGGIIADPQFVNYIKTGGGDYHLKSTSPAIDKGSATYAPATDIDGVARPQGSAVDIGAYER